MEIMNLKLLPGKILTIIKLKNKESSHAQSYVDLIKTL